MGLKILRTARIGFLDISVPLLLTVRCSLSSVSTISPRSVGKMPEVLEKYMWSHTETGKSDVQRGNLSYICTPFECYIEVTMDASNVF